MLPPFVYSIAAVSHKTALLKNCIDLVWKGRKGLVFKDLGCINIRVLYRLRYSAVGVFFLFWLFFVIAKDRIRIALNAV